MSISSTTKKVTPLERPAIYWTISDALVLAKRNLIQIPRIPEELIFATIQPIMFVLLFRYVFGGAIVVSGTSLCQLLDGWHLCPDRHLWLDIHWHWPG